MAFSALVSCILSILKSKLSEKIRKYYRGMGRQSEVTCIVILDKKKISWRADFFICYSPLLQHYAVKHYPAKRKSEREISLLRFLVEYTSYY